MTFPGGVRAVRGLDLDAPAGETLCIVGESGSGKSVAALAACGLLPPGAAVRGSIRIGGVEVTTAGQETLRKLRGEAAGFIFQDPATTLNPVLPIGRQVIEGQVSLGRVSRGAAGAAAVALLRSVEIPDPAGRARQYPHQFSGGMRQRAVIAMALAGAPRLILADEPTTALDVTVQAQVLAMLRRRQQESGAAIILITHDLGVVAEVADRVLVMYAGRIVEAASALALFRDPRHPYTAALLRSMPRLDAATMLEPIPGQPPTPAALPPGCAFQPRCAVGHGRDVCRTQDPALQEGPDGRLAACHFPGEAAAVTPGRVLLRAARAPALPLLKLEGLQVQFPLRSPLLRRRVGAVRAVDGVSFDLHAGETLGLVGESGCGKTTTGRAVIGLVPAAGGRIVFDGQAIDGGSRRAMRPVRRQVQIVFQDPFASLNPVLDVGAIIAEPLRIHGVFQAFGGAAYVAGLLERVGLPASAAGRAPREFSGGQKQRIGIARALALKPRLVILDEPVAALDVSIQAQVVNLLQELQRDLGLAYLFIAHDLSVIRHISDRVAVMYLGRIIEVGETAALYAAPAHPYTQALLAAVPIPDPALRDRRVRPLPAGEVPNPASPPSGCAFHPRCPIATSACAAVRPELAPHPGLKQLVACHHAGPARALAA